MKKNGKCGEKLFTRAYIFLILISLMTAMSYSMISTLITNYAVELGGTLAMAGTIAGIFSMAALFSRPVGGVVCDTLDKKKICMAATIVFTLSFPGYALSRNMAALLFFRMLQDLLSVSAVPPIWRLLRKSCQRSGWVRAWGILD